MKIIKYFTLLLGLVTMFSCDSFLDVKPKGYTIPEKFEDYEKLINHVSLYRALDVYTCYMTDDILLADEGDDPNGSFDFSVKDEYIKNLYRFDKGQVFTPGDNDDIWKRAYSNIFTYNAVINNVLSVQDASDSEKKRLWAEALIGRAFEYLNLVNVYGNHYDGATAGTDLGVPLVLSEEVSRSYSRNTVAEVYKRIQDDLDAAVPCLSDAVNHSFRPSKSIAYAFLAKMYLYMGDYAKALTNANEALKQSNALVDYKKYKAIPGQWGRLVTVADENVEFPEVQDNPENIYTRLLNNTSYLFKQVCASQDLLDTYARNLNVGAKDMRLELFYGQGQFDPGNGLDYFPGYTMFAPYIDMNIGFSTPEIYLIAAECEARVGSVSNALSHLNTLRDMRIMGNVHYVNTPVKSKEEALRLVIDERRREFAFFGITRLVDLKRLNREAWFTKVVKHSADGEIWELPANDLRYIMPIPQNVLSYNPDMPQYER